MIIGRDINPENSVYCIGATIIETLKEQPQDLFDFLEVYDLLKEKRSVLTINLYALSLDWLFLLGVVESKDGFLKKCF